jgi:hypothetical protein
VLEIHDRSAGFLEVFVPEVERRMPTTHSRILLVAHAAPIAALTRELLGDRNLPLKVGCCSLTDVKRKTGAKVLGGWTTKALVSGDHLSQGIQRAWGFQDVEIADAKVRFFCGSSFIPDLLDSRLLMIPEFLDPRVKKKDQLGVSFSPTLSRVTCNTPIRLEPMTLIIEDMSF